MSLFKKFAAWFRMEPSTRLVKLSLSVSPYLDMGVSSVILKFPMPRVYGGKAKRGSYRFDGETGTYFFSKADAGRPVMLAYIANGELFRKQYTIGM